MKMASTEVFVMSSSHGSFSVRKMVMIALLGAMSFVLMFIEFPIIPITPFLKIDFSDIPVLLGLIIYGPVGAICITAIKCLLHAIVYGMSIGELIGVGSSFLASLTLIIPYHYFLGRDWDNKKKMLGGLVTSTLTMTVIMSLLNWLVILPVYMSVFGMKLTIPLSKMILFGVVPFNLIKGLVVGLVFWFVAQRLNHWLAKRALK